MAYEFEDPLCQRIWDRAGTKSQIWAFAWRESPATFENHWKKKTKKMSQEEKEELTKTIFLAATAQEKYRKDEMKHKSLFRPKGIAVWFNSGDWGSDIGSHAELKERTQVNKCHCGRDVHGPNYDKCDYHLGTKEGKLVGWEVEMMRKNYIGQDLNCKYLNQLHMPGNFMEIVKLINIWNKTAHNGHVKMYKSNRYNKN